MKYCKNCGKEVNEGAVVCLNCGHALVEPTFQQPVEPTKPQEGKGLSTIAVIFGSLGFWPLIMIGSIVGFITGLIGMLDNDNAYKGRAKIGFWLSISSFAFWILMLIISAATGEGFYIDIIT